MNSGNGTAPNSLFKAEWAQHSTLTKRPWETKQSRIPLRSQLSFQVSKEMIHKPSSTMDKIRVSHDLLGHVPVHQRFFLLESLEMQFLTVLPFERKSGIVGMEGENAGIILESRVSAHCHQESTGNYTRGDNVIQKWYSEHRLRWGSTSFTSDTRRGHVPWGDIWPSWVWQIKWLCSDEAKVQMWIPSIPHAFWAGRRNWVNPLRKAWSPKADHRQSLQQTDDYPLGCTYNPVKHQQDCRWHATLSL